MSSSNENKLIPNLRFPEFNDTPGWTKNSIENLVDLQSGFAFQSIYFSENGKKLLTPKNFTKDGYANFDLKNTKFTIEDCDSKYICNEGDLMLLLTDLTPSCELLGKPLLLKKNDNEVLLNQRIVRITPKENSVYTEFLFFFFLTEKFHKRIKDTATGSTVRHSSNLIISETSIFIPKEKEQKKIASCLSSLDEVIIAENQKLEILQNHKKGLLQNLLPQEGETVPKFRFKKFEDTGDWEETTLTQIAEYENGKAHEQDIADDGEFIVVNSKFISQDGEVKKFTNTAFCPATKGDVLMVLSDIPNGKAIAKCFLVEENNHYTVNQRICRITPNNLNSKILYYLLNRNPYFLSFDDGVKQTNLRKEDVLNCPLFIPSDPQEQEKIATTLSSLDDLINAQNQKLDSLQFHKKGLLQGLFPNINEIIE